MRTSIKRFIAGASLAGAIGVGGAAVASAQGNNAPQVHVPAATGDPTAPTDSTPAAPSGDSTGGHRGGRGGSSENCPNMGGDTETPAPAPASTPESVQNAET